MLESADAEYQRGVTGRRREVSGGGLQLHKDVRGITFE